MVKSFKTVLLGFIIPILCTQLINSYPIGVCRLKKGNTTFLLIGDIHTGWTDKIHLEEPFLTSFDLFFKRIQHNKIPTAWHIELAADLSDQILKEYALEGGKDLINHISVTAIKNNFSLGSIKFTAADNRIGAVGKVHALFSSMYHSPENFNSVSDAVKKQYGTTTWNDFIKQIKQEQSKLKKNLNNYKLGPICQASIDNMNQQLSSKMSSLEQMVNKFESLPVLKFSEFMAKIGQAAKMNEMYKKCIHPIIEHIADLHFADLVLNLITNQSDEQRNIVMYLGQGHIAVSYQLLIDQGCTLEEGLGLYEKKATAAVPPVDIDAMNKLFAHCFTQDTDAQDGDSKELKAAESVAAPTSAAAAAPSAIEHSCGNPHCTRDKQAIVKYQRCSACKMVHYCSVDCQRAHWAAHKLVCVKKS